METGNSPVFDDTEFGGSQDGSDDEGPVRSMSAEQAAAIVARLSPGGSSDAPVEDQQTDDNDDYMSEVDRRLEVASYYRELLRSPMFENDSRAAQIVGSEVQVFARGRLEVLLAIKEDRPAPPLPESQFTEGEVKALKVILKELMKHPQLLNPKVVSEKQPAPSLRRAPAPVTEERSSRPAPAPATLATRRAPATASQSHIPKPPTSKPQAGGVRRQKQSPAVTVKKVVTGNDGEQHEIEVARVQRPEGMAAFPADMTVHTMASSASSVQAAGRGAAALATIATAVNKNK